MRHYLSADRQVCFHGYTAKQEDLKIQLCTCRMHPCRCHHIFMAVGRVTLQRARPTWRTTLPRNGRVTASRSGGATTLIFIADGADAASSFGVRSRPSRNMFVPPVTHTICVQILADVHVAQQFILSTFTLVEQPSEFLRHALNNFWNHVRAA